MARLAAALLVMLALPSAAPSAPLSPVSATASLKAPASLHAFLPETGNQSLKSSDAAFTRTPAFAWKPVRGATRYELMLATSSLFRPNGIILDDPTLTTPVAALRVALPWIDDSLWARVRAFNMNGAPG